MSVVEIVSLKILNTTYKSKVELILLGSLISILSLIEKYDAVIDADPNLYEQLKL